MSLDGLLLESRTRDGLIRCRPVDPRDRVSGIDAKFDVETELGRYPASFLERIGLVGINLCEALTFDEVPCSAFADVEHGRIFIDIKAVGGRADLRRTVHHELFHQVDFAEDRRLDSDPDWEALNSPDFRYANDAERYQRDPAAAAGPAAPGFLNRYAMSSPTEDKAVLYEALVTNRDAAQSRATRDPTLAGKVARLRRTLDALGADASHLIGPPPDDRP